MITKNWTMDDRYDFLAEVVGVHPEALDLVFGLDGYNEEVALNILDYYTGFAGFDQYIEEILPAGVKMTILQRGNKK